MMENIAVIIGICCVIGVIGLGIYQFKKLENKKLSEDIDYSTIEGLRIEARQKLNDIKPLSIGQASRISGVSPADISVLLIYLEQMRRTRGGNNE